MSIYRSRQMRPRNGHTLVVLNPSRISGCASQKEVSLEDQQDHAKEVVAEIFDGENVEFRFIATKAKGELLTRPELAEIEAAIRSRELDVIILEDLGRLIRGTEANRFCGIAVDHGTRVIAVHDCIDTWEDGWEEDVIAACRDHVGHNAHTSKRIKKKLMLRFKRNGGATPCPIAGYIKPQGAKSFHDWHVDETAKVVIPAAAEILRKELNCSMVADHLNDIAFPVGPHCRNTKWDGYMVRRLFANPILKGKPERGNMHSVKHHESGRRSSVRNPEGPVSIDVPHLAILPEIEFDELNALLSQRNARESRKPIANGSHPLKGIPRKRTRFPGQHAKCWYCGRIYVWGGNGIAGNLQCTGSRQYLCWNSIGLNGERVCNIIVKKIMDMLNALDGFEGDFRKIVDSVSNDRDNVLALQRINREESELLRQEQNLLDTAAQFGPSDAIGIRLNEFKQLKGELAIRKAGIERDSNLVADIPSSPEELKRDMESNFLRLAVGSYEFGTMMPKIVPELVVYLVRMIDGGPLLPTIQFTVDLAQSYSAPSFSEETRRLLRRRFTVNAFDVPMRELVRTKIVENCYQNLSQSQINSALDVPISERLIGESIALNEKMDSRDLSSPYELQLQPPTDLHKLRRHKHKRYSFQLADGYSPQPLD